jgi:glycosyltransferase involved in cell wall biosynthesis
LYKDKITHFCSERDGGQANAINRGFARSTGDIMAWINGDDLFMPGCFHYVAKFLMDNPEVDIIYGHRVVIDHKGWEVGRWILPPHDPKVVKYCDFVPQETLFWRRRVWDKVGPLDESFQFALDWDFILRVQEAGFKFKRLPRFLGCFRAHEDQKSSAVLQTVGVPEMNRIRTRIFGRPVGDREIRKKIRRYFRRHVLLHRAYKLRLVKY